METIEEAKLVPKALLTVKELDWMNECVNLVNIRLKIRLRKIMWWGCWRAGRMMRLSKLCFLWRFYRKMDPNLQLGRTLTSKRCKGSHKYHSLGSKHPNRRESAERSTSCVRLLNSHLMGQLPFHSPIVSINFGTWQQQLKLLLIVSLTIVPLLRWVENILGKSPNDAVISPIVTEHAWVLKSHIPANLFSTVANTQNLASKEEY